MTRVLRYVGIVAFAFLIGLSANALVSMYESGTFFETYNSSRRANLTLMCFSVTGLVTLLGVELFLKTRRSRRFLYGENRYQDKKEKPSSAHADIYAVSHDVDEWKSRKTRSSRSAGTHSVDITDIWQMILRTSCLLVPFLLFFIVVRQASRASVDILQRPVELGIALFVALFALLTASGIHQKKIWGYICGYMIAIINLILFPLGTALGLVMLLALSGTSPILFDLLKQRARRKRRLRAGKKVRVSA
jgi:hypothetical protein